MGITCSVANNVEDFLVAIRNGKSGLKLTDIQGGRTTYSGLVTHDDAAEGSKDWRAKSDRSTNLTRLSVRESLVSAGLLPLPRSLGTNVGLFVGHQGDFDSLDFVFESANSGSLKREELVRLYHSRLKSPAELVATELRMSGPRIAVSAASASAAHAIVLAAEAIRCGRIDAAVAGGVVSLSQVLYEGFDVLNLLSASVCAPFCEGEGMNLGEGAGFLVLEREGSARRRGVKLLAELAGYAITNDGFHLVMPHPQGKGLASAISQALQLSQVSPDEVDFIHAHGVGVRINDIAETRAIKAALGSAASETLVSTTKTMIGHTLSASGVMGAIACVLAVKEGDAPRIIDFGTPLEECDLNYVRASTDAKPVSTALLNSTGFGGANTALLFSRPRTCQQQAASDEIIEEEVFVTGVGVVSPAGIGNGAFRDAIVQGEPVVTPAIFSPEAEIVLGQRFLSLVDNFELSSALRSMEVRDAYGAGRYMLTAVALALDDSGVTMDSRNTQRIGLIMATDTGPLSVYNEFRKQALTRNFSPQAPQLFSNLIFNAPVGQACKLFTINGLNTVLLGETSLLEAFGFARDLIRHGSLDACVVVAADEFVEELLVARCRQGVISKGIGRPFSSNHDGASAGEGGCAFVLESQSKATSRRAETYAKVAGVAVTGDQSRRGETSRCEIDISGNSWSRAMKEALADAGVPEDAVDHISAAACGYPYSDYAEVAAITKTFNRPPAGPSVSAICSLFGYAGPTSSAFGVASTLIGMKEGWLPATAGLDRVARRCRLNHVAGKVQYSHIDSFLASAFSWAGSYAATVFCRR